MPKGIGYENSGNVMTNPTGATRSNPMPSMGVPSKSNGGGNATTNPSMPDRNLPSQSVNAKSNPSQNGTTNPSMPDRPLPKVG